jgi:arylsulfatase A-like enzyme
LKSAGVRTVLITEASAEHIAEVAPPFDEVHVVRGEDDLDVSETETPIAHLVRRAETWLRDNTHETRPTLLWIRSRGIPLPWLPPKGFADLYLEDFALIPDQSGPVAGPNEAEVEFPPEVEFPEEDLCEFAEEQDLAPEQARVPEETRFALAMYASYASLLDRWLGRLLRNLAQDPHAPTTLLLFTTGAGQVFFPGESAPAVDLAELEGTTPLRGELIQTALIARLPGCVPGDRDHAGTRRGALVQSIDLLPTVTEWLGLAAGSTVEGRSVLPLIRQTAEQIHDELLLGDGEGALALRTPESLYVETPAAEVGEDPVVGLYGKPQDRWDAANLAKQQPGLADELAARLKARRGPGTAAPS